MPAKKYKLFSASNLPEGTKARCAFFASPDGCKNGSNCKFAHVLAETTIVEDSGSVISSESEESKSRAKKGERVVEEKIDPAVADDFPFQKEVAHNEACGQKRKQRRGKSNDMPFASPKTKKIKTEDNAKVEKILKQEISTQTKPESLPSFRALALPIAPFTLPEHKQSKPTPKAESSVKEKPTDPVTSTFPTKPVNIEAPLPMSTIAGRKWIPAVKKTREHHKYAQAYDFDRYKMADQELGYPPWVRTKPFGDWCKNNPQVIAIDCEMCETKDPLSGQKDPRALCRISVVDAESEEVLLDSLVKPAWPITDTRSWINGITLKDLENVQFTLRHAQAFLIALCSEQTVILGHAVNNDLAALRLEHYCVADSAHLFECASKPTSTVGLRDTVRTVLSGFDIPQKHDSVHDALMAKACLEHWLEKGGTVEKIQRTSGNNTAEMRDKSRENQLFVHRIPKNVDQSHLSKMFLVHTSIQPESVEDVTFTSDTGAVGKTHVNFKTAAHATLAFDSLEGASEKDPSGRLQKKVYLKTGGYIRVRKMAFEKQTDDLKESK